MCLLEQQQLPTDQSLHADMLEPVSVLYSVKVHSGRLLDKIGLEIQHCAQDKSSNVKFLHAHDESEHFKEMPYTNNEGSSLIKIGPKSEDFSWFIVAIRRYFVRHLDYTAYSFITPKSLTEFTLSFVITMAIDPCTTVRIAILANRTYY